MFDFGASLFYLSKNVLIILTLNRRTKLLIAIDIEIAWWFQKFFNAFNFKIFSPISIKINCVTRTQKFVKYVVKDIPNNFNFQNAVDFR